MFKNELIKKYKDDEQRNVRAFQVYIEQLPDEQQKEAAKDFLVKKYKFIFNLRILNKLLY
jgi:hypothetical protein